MPGAAAAGSAPKKKSLHASERDTPRVQTLRAEWWRQVQRIPAQDLVFVDESGATTSLIRSHGRAPRGQRVVDAVPHGHWKVMTMLGAVRLRGAVAMASVEAPTDAELFRCFVRNSLLPALQAGDVVVWDNLGAHRASKLAEQIAEVGARLLPLPPYSPDFSPIESAWSKLKEHLRAVAPRTAEALGQAATDAFNRICPQDARGWFQHCGYVVH